MSFHMVETPSLLTGCRERWKPTRSYTSATVRMLKYTSGPLVSDVRGISQVVRYADNGIEATMPDVRLCRWRCAYGHSIGGGIIVAPKRMAGYNPRRDFLLCPR